MINLYDDQIEFVQGIRGAIRDGHKSILGVASPAFGKTVVASYITESAMTKGASGVWFLVHRKNLLRQTSKSFWAAKIEHGLITSGKRRSKMAVLVGTIGTVHSRMAGLKPPSVLFVDEAHLSGGKMFNNVIQWALSHGAIVIGLTGTPTRLDGKPLGDIFTVIVEAKSTRWLIEHGRLSRYEIYGTNVLPDLSSIKKSSGDYNREDLAEAMMSKKAIVGDAVKHWRKYANDMITVCYCVNVKHSKATAEYFNECGIPAVHVDADTTEAELAEACAGLASGRYKILCNCELVIEGFDLSMQVGKEITVECCILLRPTESEARYLQMVFRALRKKPRPAVILDHAGCSFYEGMRKHGLPDDHREWTLDGKKKRPRKEADEDQEMVIQQCGACYKIFKAGPDICPGCGAPVKKLAARQINQVDGELQKIDIEAVRIEREQRKREVRSARDLRDLIALGMRRGFNRPAEWAAHTVAARKGGKASRDEINTAREIWRELMRGAPTTTETEGSII